MGIGISDDNMKILLTVMAAYPELYNKVANRIYKNFQMASAEVTLFTSYIVLMTIKNDSEFVKKMLEADDEDNHLTDAEQRIFLAAMGHERKICKQIDADKIDDGTCVKLVPIVNSIERKVKQTLFERYDYER